jgi:hypothetical protein
LTKVVKFESLEQETKTPLTPELKGFIDRVIVPILVKQYLAALSAEDKQVAGLPIDVAESPSKAAA